MVVGFLWRFDRLWKFDIPAKNFINFGTYVYAMNLLIMSLSDAIDYKPLHQTYAIRIHSARVYVDEALEPSSFYTVKEYIFDDRTPQLGEGKLFDTMLAEKIINDFKEHLPFAQKAKERTL